MLGMHRAKVYEVDEAVGDEGAFHYRGLVFDSEAHEGFSVFYVSNLI